MARQIDGARRPILARERTHLLALGRLLAALRLGAGLTQQELGLLAGLGRTQVARIETGTRRTRRSTLRRVAAALVTVAPRLGTLERVHRALVEAAGLALAEESQYAERVARRRALRSDRAYATTLRAEETRLAVFLHEWSRTTGLPAERVEEVERDLWLELGEQLSELLGQRRQISRLLADGTAP